MKGFGVIILAAAVLHAADARAGSVQVEAAPCADIVRVRAQDAPLGEVLTKLAAALDIRVDAQVPLTETVTTDRKGPPERLLKNLLKGANVVLQSDPSPKCGGKERISTVWVLPAGQDGPARAASSPAPAEPVAGAQAAAAEAKKGLRPVRPRGTRRRMSEEQWQQMKRDYQAGKVQADPETGLPIPVEHGEEPQPPAEAE